MLASLAHEIELKVQARELEKELKASKTCNSTDWGLDQDQ